MRTRRWKDSIAGLLTGAVLLAVPVLAILYLSPVVFGSVLATATPSVADSRQDSDDGLLRVAAVTPSAEVATEEQADLRDWTDTFGRQGLSGFGGSMWQGWNRWGGGSGWGQNFGFMPWFNSGWGGSGWGGSGWGNSGWGNSGWGGWGGGRGGSGWGNFGWGGWGGGSVTIIRITIVIVNVASVSQFSSQEFTIRF